MTWGSCFWALIVLLATLLLALELTHLRSLERPWRWLRFGLPLLTILVSIWIHLSAWICVQHLRNVGFALAGDRPEDMTLYFDERVLVGAKEYARGPDLVRIYTTPPPKMKYVPPTRQEIDRAKLIPGLNSCDLFHVYVLPLDEGPGTQMPGLILFRFRLGLSGWKIDRELHWGCLYGEEEAAFLSRMWTPAGW